MNISKVGSCYGCGVCTLACGKKIIKIRRDKDGFYVPYIDDAAKCTDCGLCAEVCAFLHPNRAIDNAPVKSFAAWSKEEAVRHVCSSGGVGFEIGRSLLEKGFQVLGVRYNVEGRRAEHYVASSEQELLASMGSKYIQSYTYDALQGLNRKGKYLVTGTPCQIDSFRRYVRKFRCEGNFVLMDFFCHGVPSGLIWDKYVEHVERKIGRLEFVSWRNKQKGWHDSWGMAMDSEEHVGQVVDWHDSYNLLIRGKKGFLNSLWSEGDLFYYMFLGNNCLGKACYDKCKYKYNHSSADIRIGDLWGDTFSKEEKGVTAAIAFTDKGLETLLQSNCHFQELPFETVAEGQIKNNIRCHSMSRQLILYLARQKSVSISCLSLVSRITNRCSRLFSKG